MILKPSEISALISTAGHDIGIRVRSTSVAADSLDPDQAQRLVRPNLDQNCLTILSYSSKNFFSKKVEQFIELKWSNCFSRGSIPYFKRLNAIVTFQGRGSGPLSPHPSGSAHGYNFSSLFCINLKSGYGCILIMLENRFIVFKAPMTVF